ncbi:MAG: TolC family protein [Candidatus Heteroscillospira sp.]|jgi:outer membrane protein TolC
MKKKLAVLLAAASVFSALSVPALAADSANARPVAVQISASLTQGHPNTESGAVTPDAEGELSFANLGARMLENNKNLLVLEENIAAVEAIDYDKMTEDVRDKLNDTADLQWMNMVYIKDSYTGASLQQAYDALKSTYDDLREGKLQKDNSDKIKMMKNAENQILMAGESLYVALQDMNRNLEQLERQLQSTDRTLKEMELRYQLGQISALQLEQVRAGRASLVSGIDTLKMNIKTYNMQMQMMVGETITGELSLKSLPTVSDDKLAAMELDKDLISAKAASYSLLDAKNVLEDAREDYEDAGDEYHHNTNKYEYVAAQHVWQAAQYQYDGVVQTYEANFRALFYQVKDYRQVLEAAKTSLELEKNQLAVVQMKYDQGSISYNELLDAKDKVAKAEDSVTSAEVNLFSAYNNYRWAVEHGILN